MPVPSKHVQMMRMEFGLPAILPEDTIKECRARYAAARAEALKLPLKVTKEIFEAEARSFLQWQYGARAEYTPEMWAWAAEAARDLYVRHCNTYLTKV